MEVDRAPANHQVDHSLDQYPLKDREEESSLYDQEVEFDLKDLDTFDQNELDEENPNFRDGRSDQNDDEFRYDQYLEDVYAPYAEDTPKATTDHDQREHEINELLKGHQKFEELKRAQPAS